jgi:hypothetical protein
MLIGAALAERIIGHRIGLAAFGTATIMGATMLVIGLAPVGLAIVAVAFIMGGGANSVHNVAVRTMRQPPISSAACLVLALESSGGGYSTEDGLFYPVREIHRNTLAQALKR